VTEVTHEGGGTPAPTLQEQLPLLLDELRQVARRQLAREGSRHTLQTTDLIHEAYLRLADAPDVLRHGRPYFWAAAARAMRQVLVDAARRRQAGKRGGGARAVPLHTLQLDDGPAVEADFGEEMLALDDALEALGRRSARQALVVECRFFGGMSVEDTAEALGVSPRTVKADWAMARAWLYEVLRDDRSPHRPDGSRESTP
jgi:RNA polymerase sigma factor (TIGR02999 family)